MKLIIGGAFQGKLTYVLSITDFDMESVADETSTEQSYCTKPVINHLHCIIQKWIACGNNPIEKLEEIINENPDVIFIGNELGSGIVPINPDDRRLREQTGRIYCLLAKQAKEVHRVICGIGTVIFP